MKALIQLCLLVLLMLSWCAPALAQADLYARAEQAFSAQDYAAALELYQEISKTYSTCPLSALRQAQSCVQLERWDEAVAAYERLEQLGPLDAETRMAYGDALKAAGRLQDAIKQYSLVVDAEDAHAQEPPAAKPAARVPAQAIEAKPAPAPLPAQSVRDTSKTASDTQAGAVGVVEASAPSGGGTSAKPASLPAATPQEFSAGDTLRALNRVEQPGAMELNQPGVFMQSRSEGKQDGEKGSAEENKPQTPEEVLVQARRYFELEQYERAVAEYEAYANMTGADLPRDVLLEYADALRESDRLDDAEAEFNRLLHKNADDVDAKAGLAKTLAKRGELEDAMYLLDQIYQSEEALIKAYLARAYAYLVNGYVQEAWGDLGEAMAIDPNDPGVLRMEQELRKHESELARILPDDPTLRAEALFGQGQYEQSRGLYEQMVRKDPTNTRAWLRLATIYRWDGAYADSLDAYSTYLKGNPDDYEAQLRYAQVLYFNNQLTDAEDELKALLRDTDVPEEIYEEALVVYGAVLNALGRRDEAAELYREALVYDPHNVSTRSQYAGVLASMNRYEEAVAQYEAALREDPGNSEVKLGLARTYSWKGDQRKAQQYYNEIGMADSYYGASRLGLAYSHLASGDRSQALALAAEAEKYDPNNPELAALRAQLSNTGEPSMAMTWRQSHDSDDNDTRSVTTRLDIPLDARGSSLSLEYEDFKLDNTDADQMSSGKYTRAALSLPLTEEMSLNLRGGYLDIGNGDDPSISEWTHGMSLAWQVNDRLSLNTGYSDYTFYDTTELARNNINLQEYTVGGMYKLAANTALLLDYSWADLSDDNCRERLTMNLQRGYTLPSVGRLFYGVAYRYLNYSQDLSNGYWDPSNYHYSEVYADWFDMSQRKLRFDGGIGYGIDNADGQSSSSAFRYYAGLRAYPWGDRLVLKAGYRSSEAADTSSATGYRSAEWYLTGVYNF